MEQRVRWASMDLGRGTRRPVAVRCLQLLCCLVWAELACRWAVAQTPPPAAVDVRYYDENGVRFQETRYQVRQPVREVRTVDQPVTEYQTTFRTAWEPRTVTSVVPVTQYEVVPRLHDWWRIFGEPYVAYHLEPYTVWTSVTHSTSVPVTRQETQPQTRTVRLAVPQLRFETQERVTRVALGPSSNFANGDPSRPTTVAEVTVPQPSIAQAAPGGFGDLSPNSAAAPQFIPARGGGATGYGGIARLEGDPPRYGTVAGAGGWQARR